jgi:threonine aldolase
MQRRDFIGLGALATAATLINPNVTLAGKENPEKLLRTIKFHTDGLDLDPREYSALLSKLATEGKIKADNYSLGGTIESLEIQFARLLGKESAVFMPTGTLANQVAVRKLAGANKRVLVQAESHLYNDSGDCAEVLSGLNLIPLASGQATFMLDEVKHWVERSSSGRVETRIGVISIESPVRRKHHEMFDFEEMRKICAYARENHIGLHLDGARLFNVPYHSGKEIREYTSLFDTVYVSLWKCFNAVSGAVLAGSKQFTEGLFHTRRMFGGGLPQAWPCAAVALQYADTYVDEYSKAWRTADRFLSLLQKDKRFAVEKIANGTSAFKLSVQGGDPGSFAERLLARNIVLPRPQTDGGIFWMVVNTTLNSAKPEELAKSFVEAL